MAGSKQGCPGMAQALSQSVARAPRQAPRSHLQPARWSLWEQHPGVTLCYSHPAMIGRVSRCPQVLQSPRYDRPREQTLGRGHT